MHKHVGVAKVVAALLIELISRHHTRVTGCAVLEAHVTRMECIISVCTLLLP